VNKFSENDEKMVVEQPNDFPSAINGNLVEEKAVKVKDDEMEAESVIKKEGFTLNAKVNQEVVDSILCATVGWQAGSEEWCWWRWEDKHC
jgi:hypothetical protein